MNVVSHFIKAVATVVDMALYMYMWVIIARAILSWVSPDPYNPVVRFIHDITEPLLRQIRKRLPNIQGMDISPIIAIFGIIFLQIIIVNNLQDLANKLRF